MFTGWALLTGATILQIPAFDTFAEFLPDFIVWGQHATDAVQFIYAVIGAIMAFYSMKILKIRVRDKQLDLIKKERSMLANQMTDTRKDYEALKQEIEDLKNQQKPKRARKTKKKKGTNN